MPIKQKTYPDAKSFPQEIQLMWSALTNNPPVELPPMTKGQAIRRRQLMYMYRKALANEGVVEAQKLEIYSLHVEETTPGWWRVAARQDELGHAIMRQLGGMKLRPADMRKVEEIKGLNMARDTSMETERVMQKQLARPGRSEHSLTVQPVTVRDGGTHLPTGGFVSAVDAALAAKQAIDAGEIDEVLMGMEECPRHDPLMAARWELLRQQS